LQLTRSRWEAEANARGVRYDVRFDDEARGADHVSASASELREVFVNLIFNALDAMPGGGALTVRERRAGEEVVVEVSDTGAGIAPDVSARIFEPFFTTKGKQGSGLGLAVSHGIVARHGGSLTVESEPGAGTTFTVRLPCCAENSEVGRNTGEYSLPRRRVLIVDDDASVRDVLAEMLAELGQEAVAVAGAHEALGALAASRFDLMITDLSMPGMDGLRLAAEARSASPRTRVALATGYGRGVPSDAVGTGLLDAMLDKPFQIEAVAKALRRLLASD
jgi:two-component system, cell cycle sensor histidine kinase and response regulator CckA